MGNIVARNIVGRNIVAGNIVGRNIVLGNIVARNIVVAGNIQVFTGKFVAATGNIVFVAGNFVVGNIVAGNIVAGNIVDGDTLYICDTVLVVSLT